MTVRHARGAQLNRTTEETIDMRTLLMILLMSIGLSSAYIRPTQAQTSAESIKFALCYDLSKVNTFISPQYIQAANDYAKLLNAKGGIEGHPIEIIVQDHGSEPQRGIECYEKMKHAGAIAFDFFSSPVSRAVLPRAMKDGRVMLSPFVGRADAVDGSVYKWIFSIGPTYWGQAANAIHYIKTKSNGSLKGVKVAFLYIDYPFGQEPIALLKNLAEREGFDLQLYPHPLPGNDQASAWSQMRRFDPDWIIHWGLSAHHVVASREMKRNGLKKMDRYISVNWLNETDISNIGAQDAKGLKRISNVVGGQSHPLIKQILTDLYEKGNGSGDRKNFDIYYNMSLANFAVVFEGARLAIKQHGWPLNPDKMRLGFESIRNFDANGLIAPVTVTATDHGGGGKTRMETWDGANWVADTGWSSAYEDLVWDLVKKESAKFADSFGK